MGKMSTARTLNIRNVNLLNSATFLVTFIAIFNVVTSSPSAKPMDHSAYMLYRQGKWVSVPVSKQTAYQIFRRG